jgi:apolipoprotein N-acyltransferase
MAGWLVGASAELAIYYWLPGTVERYGGLPRWFAVFVWLLFAFGTGIYAAIFAWGFTRVRALAGAHWPFAIAAWFCALEFLNPQIFGYLQGVAWYQVPRFFLVSALTGVSGVSFLVILCNAVIFQGLELRAADEVSRQALRRAWLVNAAILVVLVAGSIAYSSVRLGHIAEAERDAPKMRIALIQPNHTIERRFEIARHGADAFARDLLTLSEEAAAATVDGGKIDVFVWPEGALRDDPMQPSNRSVREFVGESGAEVWTGGGCYRVTAQRTLIAHNSAFRIFADGAVDRRYDKNILVPFGEYVPLRDVIPGFDRIPAVGNFEPGRETPVYTAGPARFIFLICYEAIRSRYVRAALKDDVNLLVNVTVDAWYGDTSEQSEHLMLAATQSALLGVPLVRSTTTGISAFVDARGKLVAETGKYTREFLVRDVQPMHVPGLYARIGDWFAWLCVAASALLMLASFARRRTAARRAQ